jgi:predicted GIY-YIG superfamily endonuclease
MPRPKINDYTFYKIVNINGDVELCYVGSTADIKQRHIHHKLSCNNPYSDKYNQKVYTTIREHGGWDEFKMIEIAFKAKITKREAEVIEEQYRQELNAELNSKRCFRSEEEKKDYQKNYQIQYRKQYNIDNADKIKERQNTKVNCECGGRYTLSNKSIHFKSKLHQQYIINKNTNNICVECK